MIFSFDGMLSEISTIPQRQNQQAMNSTQFQGNEIVKMERIRMGSSQFESIEIVRRYQTEDESMNDTD